MPQALKEAAALYRGLLLDLDQLLATVRPLHSSSFLVLSTPLIFSYSFLVFSSSFLVLSTPPRLSPATSQINTPAWVLCMSWCNLIWRADVT